MSGAARAHGRSFVLAAVGLVLVVLAVVFTNAPGWLIADARYEHSAAPTQFLARHSTVWDAERTIGDPAAYFSPVLGAYQAGFEQLGAAPWVVQRMTHALLLASAAVGMLVLARRITGRLLAAVAAAVLFTLNPFVSQYLAPSGLFVAYALAPWLAYASVRGGEGRHRWRWAAWFALLVFAMGLLNTPALVFAVAGALVIGAGWAATDGAGIRRWSGWAWRAALLAIGVSAPAAIVLGLNGDEIRANLETTETPETVARTSAAAESWRGLGSWLTYFRSGGRFLRDEALPYLTDPLVIVATFVAVGLGAVGLVFGSSRLRPLLAVMAAASVVVMVGLHPVDDPSAFGRAIGWLFDSSDTARGFRSTYKAGVVLELALALLGGMAVVAIVDRLRSPSDDQTRSRRIGTFAAAALAAVGIAVAAFPFLTGSLYSERDRLDELPAYWHDAFEWFDGQPEGDAVLVVPGVTRARYRWGYVNDNLFDAHLAQPVAMAQSLPQASAVLADATEAIDDHLVSPGVEPGAIAPMLRRLGVRWVLVQNDLDTDELDLSGPATLESLRTAAGLRRVAAFGEPGENVAAGPPGPQREFAESLPPIEIYEVEAAAGSVPGRLRNNVVVIGGGEAWPGLATRGWLDHPIEYLGDIEPEARSVALSGAEVIVVTDGGQRRATRVSPRGAERSHVLAVDETAERVARPLFGAVEHQAVVVHEDAAAITADRYGFGVVRWETRFRPTNTMDGRPATVWAVPAGRSAVLSTLRIELEEPTEVDTLRIWPYAQKVDERHITELEVVARSPGVADRVIRVAVDPADPLAPVDVALAGSVSEIAIVIGGETSVADVAVGLREVELLAAAGPLDGREFVRVAGPAPGDEAALAEAIGDTPVVYLFQREQNPPRLDEQADIRREFWVPRPAIVDVRAEVRIDDRTPDASIDALLGAAAGSVGSSRYLDSLDGTAVESLLDRNAITAWQVEPITGEAAGIRFDDRQIDEVELHVSAPSEVGFYHRPLGYEVTVGDETGEVIVVVDTGPEIECDPELTAAAGGSCVERFTATFGARSVGSIRVEPLVTSERSGGFGAAPVRIAEVVPRLGGERVVDPGEMAPGSGCRTLLEVGGRAVAMRPTRALSLEALRDGVVYESCRTVELDPGWQRFDHDAALSLALDAVELRPTGFVLAPPRVETVEIDRPSAAARSVRTEVDSGDVVVTDVAAHDGWRVDANLAGVETVVDGRVAWRALEAGDAELDVTFAPQRSYRLAWLLTAVVLAVCIWLVLPRRRGAG